MFQKKRGEKKVSYKNEIKSTSEAFSIQMLILRGKKEEKNKEKICGPMLNFFVERRKKGTENLLLLREDREKNTGQGAELCNVHFVISGLNIYILI